MMSYCQHAMTTALSASTNRHARKYPTEYNMCRATSLVIISIEESPIATSRSWWEEAGDRPTEEPGK